MSDITRQLIPDARAFLTELSETNTREWFQSQKARYEAELRHPAEALLQEVADYLRPHHPGLQGKIFRPQRDLRFSKDKTPYHTHLHLLWQLPQHPGCGVFFGIDPDGARIGGGIMALKGATLSRWRDAVAGQPLTRAYPTAGLAQVAGHPNPRDSGFADELAALMDILALKGFQPKAPELKRVPAPHGQSHPHADLLRRKSLTLWRAVDPVPPPDPVAAVCSAALVLAPLFTLLQPILADPVAA
ncbi:DUF2461 domain-containing protein [Phaeobacter inhibens]|uniref:DUF2461 domain-containing protein n=1 Tax=Phaeobacter inhibens TaxID=221822 RepID=UPI000160D635|nr:DUF2461 domain-containing protein [Phaeobacter inhibens]AFO88018.1 hypothetical protein PGA2_c20270 [Phaeobacter inhibens 2.10]AXT42788.1 DUF2461 domain-containing protein [Phaeobacter inhibens]